MTAHTADVPPPDRVGSRVALVTGAAGGLGSAFSTALARAGVSVVVHHLGDPDGAATVARQIGAAGREHMVAEADVTDDEAVAAMFDAIDERFGRIDILVNNAGVLDQRPFLETSVAQWRRVLDVDLTGVFISSRHAVPRMLARGGGVIINIASQLAFKGAPETSAYTAAKAGVVGLTRTMARELGPQIRVNAIAPGPVDTPMNTPVADPDWLAQRTGGLVIGRMARAEEVASSVVFLAAEEATLFHGQVLHPNGGGVTA